MNSDMLQCTLWVYFLASGYWCNMWLAVDVKMRSLSAQTLAHTQIGLFWALHCAGVTHCMDGVKLTLPCQISHPTLIYGVHISTLVTTCL